MDVSRNCRQATAVLTASYKFAGSVSFTAALFRHVIRPSFTSSTNYTRPPPASITQCSQQTVGASPFCKGRLLGVSAGLSGNYGYLKHNPH